MILCLCAVFERRRVVREFWTHWRQENSTEAEKMADLLNLLMLICASVGSLAFGVLAAYGIFRAAFALMRPQRRTRR